MARTLVPWAVVLAGAVWAVHDVDWRVLRSAFHSARPSFILLAALFNFGALFFQAARWHALLRPFSGEARLGRAFEALVIGFAVSTVVPARAGELARVQWLRRRTRLSSLSIAGSLALDHLVNGAGLVAGLSLLPHLIDVPWWVRLAALVAGVGFATGVTVAFAVRPVPGDEPRLQAAASTPGLRGVLARARQGMVAAHHPRALLASFAFSLVAWAFELAVVVASLDALGLHLPLSGSLLVLLTVNVALAFPFAPPGNFGTLEVGAVLGLLALGVSKEHALLFAIVYHALQVGPVAAVGLVLAGGRELMAVGHGLAPGLAARASRD